MSLSRRSILSALLGGAASAAARVSPRDAAKALGVPLNAPFGEVVHAASPVAATNNMGWQLEDLIRTRLRAQRGPDRYLPPHIAGKKSWSPVFKASVHAQEEVMLAAFLQKVRDDAGFFEKVASALIGEGPRHA